MNTEPQGWDRNLRLGRGFWLTFVIVGPVTWLVVWPGIRDMPLLSQIAGSIVLPFLAAVVVYTIIEIIRGGTSRKQIRALCVTIVFIFVCGVIAHLVGGGIHKFFLPGLMACAAIIIYNIVLGKF